VTVVALCILLRIVLVPVVDMMGRSSVSASAATKLGVAPADGSEFSRFGGWLNLPWLRILAAGDDPNFTAAVFQPGNDAKVSTVEFRHYFAAYFIRWFILRTWWIGAVVGVILVLRRGGGVLDVPWAIIAGAAAGFAVAATLAAFFLIAEVVPTVLWHLAIGKHGGIGFLLLWIVLALICWVIIGLGLGVALPIIAPLRRLLVDPFQSLIAAAFGLVGMKSLAAYWSPY
jgi:hypothetical protein